MGGDEKSDSKTTTQILTPEQQRLAALSAGNYETFAATSPTLPGAAGVAGFDPLQTQGQNEVLGSVSQAKGTVDSANAQSQKLTAGDYLDPDNASTAGAIRAATRPITDTYRDVTLPGIAADASTSGSGGVSANFGGSRHGVAEGIASRSMLDKVGDVSGTIANTARQSNMDQMLKALGLAPQTAAASTIPGGITSTVGDIRQGQNQRLLDAEAMRKQFEDFLPLLKAQVLGQGAAGLPGGSTTAVGSSSGTSNPVNQLIGGTAAAGGLAGGLANLLPVLALSDRRGKKDITYLRTLENGHRWYSFRYIDDDRLLQEGVMADEVLQICPEAVFINSNGLMVVDYSQIVPPKELVHG